MLEQKVANLEETLHNVIAAREADAANAKMKISLFIGAVSMLLNVIGSAGGLFYARAFHGLLLF